MKFLDDEDYSNTMANLKGGPNPLGINVDGWSPAVACFSPAAWEAFEKFRDEYRAAHPEWEADLAAFREAERIKRAYRSGAVARSVMQACGAPRWAWSWQAREMVPVQEAA